jgi:prepilin-type N-terminal cleavage/methylation domain-containing protein
MMARRTHMKRGFTLVELLVVIAVLAVVSSIGVQMFSVIGDRQRTQQIRLDLAGKTDQALEIIRRDVARVISARLGGVAIAGESRMDESRRFGNVILEDDRITLPVQDAIGGKAPDRYLSTFVIDRSGAAPRLVKHFAPLGGKPTDTPSFDLVKDLHVQSLRIEYFDGAAWQRAWSAATHPRAVRVSLVAVDSNRPYEQLARTLVIPVQVD